MQQNLVIQAAFIASLQRQESSNTTLQGIYHDNQAIQDTAAQIHINLDTQEI